MRGLWKSLPHRSSGDPHFVDSVWDDAYSLLEFL